ncbi:amino acid ABC transporter [Psychromonas sp. psych-6C06]|uniref:transporter substrate-binding domain-containing protein n=1 Tax=Psychromonas sp. psych-6C06 TaxID=2058089 RepID=UPI000C32718A|nr:transporter substrate-binding domain-containing protein [Psychromonas sp. psych-6C06]PKF60766.1 amino acid ABC transporter [Psychromonas sp. psych-6C06]
MKLLILFSTLCFSFFILPSQACTLKMGYRTTARLPNIEAQPSNKGLYLDLYTKAAKRIGCQLEVSRQPKKRILRDLGRGTLDFYPGLSFREERSLYILFFANGLPSADIGLTRVEVPEINSFYDLKGKSILRAYGGTSVDANEYGVTIKTPPELSFESAIDYILNKNADFYEDEIGTLSYYLKDHPRAKELKFHLNCCGGLTELTVGFSRASPHLKEEANPDYDPSKELDYNNFPKRVAERSTAYRFQQALMELKKEGYTNNLFLQYYGVNIEELLSKK